MAGDVQAAGGVARGVGSLTGNSNLNAAGSLAGNALGIYSGIERGGVAGYAGAGLSAASAANNVSRLATGSNLFSNGVGATIGGLGNVLGIYNGIRQGGVQGYGGAALNAYQLYNTVSPLLSGASTAAAGSGGVGAGAGAGAGAGFIGAGAVALAMAPAIAGMRSSGVTTDKSYWQNFSNALTNGFSTGNKTMDANSSPTQRQDAYNQTIISMLAGGGNSSMGGITSAQRLPPDVLAYAKKNGLFDAANALMSVKAGGGGHSPTSVKQSSF